MGGASLSDSVRMYGYVLDYRLTAWEAWGGFHGQLGSQKGGGDRVDAVTPVVLTLEGLVVAVLGAMEGHRVVTSCLPLPHLPRAL